MPDSPSSYSPWDSVLEHLLRLTYRLQRQLLKRKIRKFRLPPQSPPQHLYRQRRRQYAAVSSNVPLRNVRCVYTDTPPPVSSVILTCGYGRDLTAPTATPYGCVPGSDGRSSTRGSIGSVDISSST
jgi:hypothetical protein